MTNLDPTANSFAGAGPDPSISRDLRLGMPGRGRLSRKASGTMPPMPLGKRAFDVTVALLLLLLLWPLLLALAGVLLAVEGRPLFYVGDRMCSPTRSFKQIKFRTMRVGADAVGGVTGGDKAHSISPLHRILRRTRLDELPQLINVLRGDMSLVGPRPPLRRYVELFPEIYHQVLQSRPGVTGLATLYFHEHEEKLLAPCRTHQETEAVYRRRCIPRKARLDLIYQDRRTLWLDLLIVARTAKKPFWRLPRRSPGAISITAQARRAAARGRRNAALSRVPSPHPAE
jgi:lipopolysaccharide/colanic/teichoic acid biosynthesis glycosyltransferase